MIASNGAATLLVDCDLRNPSLSRSIAPGASSGIVELALGKVSLGEAHFGKIAQPEWRSCLQS